MTPGIDKTEKAIKIGFFGDGTWAQNSLQLFIDDPLIQVDFICLRYNSPDEILEIKGREQDIDVLNFQNVNDELNIKKLSKYGTDLFVSMSYDQILKEKIIYLPSLHTINCHAGKLPFYRGRNVLNWALINDEGEFGITVHYVDEGIDTGDIILQATFPISDEDNYATLLDVAHVECARLLHEAIIKIRDRSAHRIAQLSIHPTGFYCGKRIQGDEIINWNQTSREIFNFIRALATPGPKARSLVNGEMEIQINKAQIVEEAPSYVGINGHILYSDDDKLLVKTRDSFIKIVDFECPGNIRIGDRLE